MNGPSAFAEWAQVFTIVGFIGYALVTTVVGYRFLTGRSNIWLTVFCLVVFMPLLALTSAFGALSAPPLRWLSAEAGGVARGVTVWSMFLFVLVGSLRRAPR